MKLKRHGGKGIQPESCSVYYYNLEISYFRFYISVNQSSSTLEEHCFNPITNKIRISQLKWNVLVKKYSLAMSQIYRRPSQLDILL